MKILYIYRHPDMGFSIGKVFKPIEEEMRKYAEVDAVYLPCSNYQPKSLWKNIRAARKAVSLKRYDIIHITGAEHYLIPFLKKGNVVVTVHDLGVDQLTFSIRGLWRKLLWVRTIPFAAKVTFISKQTMEDAFMYIKLRNDQWKIINNPLGKDFRTKPKSFCSQCPIILHIGTAQRKNLHSTIKALYGIRCKLRIIGSMSDEIIRLLNENEIDYSNDVGISDQQILEEYEKCDIVDFPSFYEGFGMPIIEAQMTGRPVVTSNLSPMKDVAGKGAVLINPYDTDSIRDGYLYVFHHYDEIVKNGLDNVHRFQLERIVKSYKNLYEELIYK